MNSDFNQVMGSLRSVREFTDEPVSDADLQHVLEMATRAPNGGNAQTWRFLVLRDAAVRREIGRLYLESLLEQVQAKSGDEVLARPSTSRTLRDSMNMAMRLGEQPPVLILVCSRHRGSYDPGASVFPGVQNLMLAAWSLGLGTVLTTVFLLREAEVRSLLGIPDDVYIGCLLPLGHPARPYGPPKRLPMTDVVAYDRWNG